MISWFVGKRRGVVEDKLSRASKFLEELEELSVWMSATRELLHGQQEGKPGFHVDPEVRKSFQKSNAFLSN